MPNLSSKRKIASNNIYTQVQPPVCLCSYLPKLKFDNYVYMFMHFTYTAINDTDQTQKFAFVDVTKRAQFYTHSSLS